MSPFWRPKLPAILDPALALQRQQTEKLKQHAEWAAERERKVMEDSDSDRGVPATEPGLLDAQAAERMRHPNIDVDGNLEVKEMRVITRDDLRRDKDRAALLRVRYQRDKGFKR